MKKFFRQLSFRRKLLISFVTLSCIPVLLVGIAAYHLYTNFIINMTEKSSIETIDLSATTLTAFSMMPGASATC